MGRRAVPVGHREDKIAELYKQLVWLDGHASGPYLLGENATLADLTWSPTCIFMEFMLPRVFGWANPFDPDVSSCPKVAAWYQHCKRHPAFAEVHNEIWTYWEEMERKGQFAPI